MKSELTKTLPKQGCFDLQGYNSKPKLPMLKLDKTRSVTPNLANFGNSTQRDLDLPIFEFEAKNKQRQVLSSEGKLALPTEIKELKMMMEKETDLIGYKGVVENSALNMGRIRLILLEKWMENMLSKNEGEEEAVYTMCFREIVKDVMKEFSNRGKLLLQVFTGLIQQQKKREKMLEKEIFQRESEKNTILAGKIAALEDQCSFVKEGMNDFIMKSMAAEEKTLTCEHEIEVLRQIIQRFQTEYKLVPIDFSKISELVIEDVIDDSKKSRKKIANSVIPKLNKNCLVQTIESLIVTCANKQTQAKPKVSHKYSDAIVEFSEITTQTDRIQRRARRYEIIKQESIGITPRVRGGKKNKIFGKSEKSETYSIKITPALKNSENSLSPKRKKEKVEELGIKNQEELEDNELFTSFSRNLEAVSACSCKSSSNNSFEILPMDQKFQGAFNQNRSYAQFNRHSKGPISHRKPIFQTLISPAFEVLSQCLQIPPKKLSNDALLSLRTLNKTINSMYFSSIYKIKTQNFTTFLDHVFSRLSNKYSLKKMREKRLKDLIASSVKNKDTQTPKLFLRMIGAGKCIGLSNYSIHTFKILLQILNFFELSALGLFIPEINGKKLCTKVKALECAREIFTRRLEFIELSKLMTQIESHSKSDSYGLHREGVVDYEWLLNYLLYTFDFYEKQVLSGTRMVVEAVSLSSFSICMTKAEFFVAYRAIYKDSPLDDRNLMRIYKFLRPEVLMSSLVSVNLVEKLALFKGLFKQKAVENFRKEYVKPISEFDIDKFSFTIDNISEEVFSDTISKSHWQHKIAIVGDQKNADLSFAILSLELDRILKAT